MSYYLSNPVLQFYFSELEKAGQTESAANHFWANALSLYFTQDKLYGIELEQRPLSGAITNRDGITILCVRSGTRDTFPTKIVLLEDKKNGREADAATWADITKRLTEYLELVRTEQGDEETLYGIAAIGSCLRFYYLVPHGQALQDYPTENTGGSYDLKRDEAENHNILTELALKASP
ncbi:uncharacterized protein GIQ15_05500 [Arthroderma uncinatum]|uniref:uncharacterized protein n=1 Tax=Arthroderma uncinatum TaxID=74035 RepID=UPI00144A8CF7|nr:uncharacterized protein GIQ15_05500 [Arthroderma uncinatum]KAF3480153.1 hypothetical protein GIQ15_05500 [Arthroderma uncinatum]